MPNHATASPWMSPAGLYSPVSRSLTGETMTGAVTPALRERLERERRLRQMRAIAERCAKLLGPGPSAIEHGGTLYDERGRPG